MLEIMNQSPIAVVTGANGFVGSHLVDLLLEKQFVVRCIIRSTSNLQWLEGKNVELYKCGLTNVEALKEPLDGAAYVFHIAGAVSAKKAEGFYKGNVETTRNILEAALGNSTIKKILVTSSLAATGPTDKGKPVDEQSPCNPMTTYGFSKLEQEQMVKTYMDRLPITIVRPPAVYGERDTDIFLFFKAISKGVFTQLGFSSKSLSLVHAKDLVHGMYLAATYEGSSGETYFLGSEQPEYEWPDIARISGEILGKKPVRVRVPHMALLLIGRVNRAFKGFMSKPPTLSYEKAQEIIQPSWSCRSDKAMKELGYKEQRTIEEGIRQTIEWYKKEGWL